MKTCLWIFLTFLFFQLRTEGSLLSPDSGTIVITYQTDQAGTRLNRIRFWLINENQERTLYPKKNEFVSNTQAPNERTVVITHLPLGKYRIEFLVPNTDKLFEDVPPRDVILTAEEVVKIDQTIPLQRKQKNNFDDFKEIAQEMLRGRTKNYPSHFLHPYISPYNVSGKFSLTSNQPQAAWRLILQNRLIYEGRGSIDNIVVPPGENYLIQAEPIRDHTFYTTPQIPFNIPPNRHVKMVLDYRRDTGTLTLKGEVPSQVINFTITIYSKQPGQAPININIPTVKGNVLWKSAPIPTGEYILSYNIPNFPAQLENKLFIIKKDFDTLIHIPSLIKKGSLEIISENPQALYTLVTDKGAIIGKGKGPGYLFKDLEPGYYNIQFSSTDPNIIPSKPSQQVVIHNNQMTQVKINFLRLGRLTINSNDPTRIVIRSSREDKEISKNLTNKLETIHLPEGLYQFIYQPLAEKSIPSQPIEIYIDAKIPKSITIPSPLPPPEDRNGHENPKGKIDVNANVEEASFRIYD